MSRPQKKRRICGLPKTYRFTPSDSSKEEITLAVDEYETVRLLDYEGLTQAECAKQMNVARATITLIYERARKKIAEALVHGKTLVIEGGNISVCDYAGQCCGSCGKMDKNYESCNHCEKNCDRNHVKHI